MLKKRFNKAMAKLGHKGTVYSVNMFTRKEIDSDLKSGWAFLKKGMKVHPHRHPEKEIYIFIKGKGFMQIEHEKFPVGLVEAIYIPPNAMHTVWNEESEDLEFIYISFGARPLSIFLRLISSLGLIVLKHLNLGGTIDRQI